jgi:hypothetical protein
MSERNEFHCQECGAYMDSSVLWDERPKVAMLTSDYVDLVSRCERLRARLRAIHDNDLAIEWGDARLSPYLEGLADSDLVDNLGAVK